MAGAYGTVFFSWGRHSKSRATACTSAKLAVAVDLHRSYPEVSKPASSTESRAHASLLLDCVAVLPERSAEAELDKNSSTHSPLLLPLLGGRCKRLARSFCICMSKTGTTVRAPLLLPDPCSMYPWRISMSREPMAWPDMPGKAIGMLPPRCDMPICQHADCTAIALVSLSAQLRGSFDLSELTLAWGEHARERTGRLGAGARVQPSCHPSGHDLCIAPY